MEDYYIQSKQNEQVKNLVRLRERKHRDRQKRFIVEGLRESLHARDAGYSIESLYYCPELFPSSTHQEAIEDIRRDGNTPLIRLSAEAMEKASYREGPDGILAIGQQRGHELHALNLPDTPLVLVLEGIEKPGNLGAILRSADGAGVEAVILVDCILDLYNPNAIRSSQGLLFALPIICSDRQGLAEWLQANHFQIVERLLARGFFVRSIGRSERSELSALGVESIACDLLDADAVRTACGGMDAVFHVAAKAGVWGSWRSFYEPNFVGTRNVIEACLSEGVSRLVHTSTPSVVFNRMAIRGGDESLPYGNSGLSHYSRSKALAEAAVLGADCAALRTVALRPHLIFGPGDPHLLPRVVDRAKP